MQVALVNEGPCTIIIDTDEWKKKGVTAMQTFHIPGAAPLYTNTFLLISDAGHAVVIDPAADAQDLR